VLAQPPSQAPAEASEIEASDLSKICDFFARNYQTLPILLDYGCGYRTTGAEIHRLEILATALGARDFDWTNSSYIADTIFFTLCAWTCTT
jgi:hypothetical protein